MHVCCVRSTCYCVHLNPILFIIYAVAAVPSIRIRVSNSRSASFGTTPSSTATVWVSQSSTRTPASQSKSVSVPASRSATVSPSSSLMSAALTAHVTLAGIADSQFGSRAIASFQTGFLEIMGLEGQVCVSHLCQCHNESHSIVSVHHVNQYMYCCLIYYRTHTCMFLDVSTNCSLRLH